MDDGPLGVPAAGPVADLGVRPAELDVVASAALGEDLHGLVQGAVAVGVLLGDDHDEAVLETDRDPQPVEALGPVLLGRAAPFLPRDRPHAPTPVAGAGPLPRCEGVLLPLGPDGSGDLAGLHEAAAFQHEAVAAPLDVVGLPDGGELGGPGDVVRESVRVRRIGGAAQRELLERHVDGDGQGPHREVHPVVGEGVGGPDGEQLVADAEGGVGVDDPGVGVDAEAEYQDGAAVVVEDVEDAPVVGVAVTADDVLHRQGRLVDGVFVERDGPVGGHGEPPGRTASGRLEGAASWAARADMTVRQKPASGPPFWHALTERRDMPGPQRRGRG